MRQMGEWTQPGWEIKQGLEADGDGVEKQDHHR